MSKPLGLKSSLNRKDVPLLTKKDIEENINIDNNNTTTPSMIQITNHHQGKQTLTESNEIKSDRRTKKLKLDLKTEEEMKIKKIQLELKSEVEMNPMSELWALFSHAIQYENHSDLISLIKGTIHECDQMLRNDSKLDESALPPDFHYIYASSLYHFGCHNESNTFEQVLEFMDAAIERCQTGLECHSVHPWSESYKLIETICLCYSKKAIHLFEKDPKRSNEEISNAIKQFEAFTINLETHSALLNVLSEIRKYAEITDDFVEMEKSIAFVCRQYDAMLQLDPELVPAIIDKGEAILSLGLYCTESYEIEEPIQDPDQIIAQINRAHNCFKLADGILKSKNESDTQVICLMGECLINLGNLSVYLDGEEKDHFYIEAIKLFEHVKDIDPEALPQQFYEFIQEWNDEINDNEIKLLQ